MALATKQTAHLMDSSANEQLTQRTARLMESPSNRQLAQRPAGLTDNSAQYLQPWPLGDLDYHILSKKI